MKLAHCVPAVLAVSCGHASGGGPSQQTSTPEPAASELAAPAAPSPSPPDRDSTSCQPPAVPRLTSWLEVRVPGTYWLELVRADHRWEPAERLAMPLHHATRLELTNLGGVPALADGGPDRVRVTVELTARDVQHDERRATWFVTYRARILDACPAGG